MKKLMFIVLACVLVVSLCACGKAQEETPATTAATTAPTATDATDSTEANPQNLMQLAREYTNRPISELYEAIGYPDSYDYAPSCMGEGEDGNLYYDGFIVYTYKEGDTETVYFVE